MPYQSTGFVADRRNESMPGKSVLASDAGGTQKSATMTDTKTVLPEDSRIDRASPIPDQVYRILRQAIITLRMPPGSVIIEKQITDQLGISRTPVRDAIRQLAD